MEAGIFSGEVVIDNYFWLHRLQDQYLRWSKATGGSAIEVHIYGPPELLAEPDALLLARAAAAVDEPARGDAARAADTGHAELTAAGCKRAPTRKRHRRIAAVCRSRAGADGIGENATLA